MEWLHSDLFWSLLNKKMNASWSAVGSVISSEMKFCKLFSFCVPWTYASLWQLDTSNFICIYSGWMIDIGISTYSEAIPCYWQLCTACQSNLYTNGLFTCNYAWELTRREIVASFPTTYLNAALQILWWTSTSNRVLLSMGFLHSKPTHIPRLRCLTAETSKISCTIY